MNIQNKEISIISVNYNGYKDTCSFIDSCFQYIKEYILELIIVDNGSINDESLLLKNKYPQIITIRSEKNIGFAGANNLAYRYTKGKYIFFLNNDIIICNRNLNILINTLNLNDNIAGVSPIILNLDKSIQYAGYTKMTTITLRNKAIGETERFLNQYITKDTPYLHGAAMLFKRKAIEKIGLMSEEYFLYYEEFDWCEKFRNKHFKLLIEPKYQVIHKNSGTIGLNSPTKIYYLTRNRLLFAKKNRNIFHLFFIILYLIFISTSKNILFALLTNKKDIALAYFRGIKDFIINK